MMESMVKLVIELTKAKYESSLWRLLPCVNLLFRSGHKFLIFLGLQLKFKEQIKVYFSNRIFLGFIIYVLFRKKKTCAKRKIFSQCFLLPKGR